jgi:alkylation response protein AidB-like acyl-CoA dehydrogenase
MTLELGDADRAFRDELRRWLDQNLRHAGDRNEWHRRLVADRWAVPSWPERYGGRKCSVAQEIVYNREMAARDAPLPKNEIGLFNIGPTLIALGTAEQQARYLPPMLAADEIWCQGFSEPGAGSDLASLATRAEDRGDAFVVNGQKVWTTFGAEADRCLMLVRTDPARPKHRGLSALVVDMHAPGVEVRPLREISGDANFSEIFLNDVTVLKSDLVAGLNHGWRVAMQTLVYERLGTMKLGVQLEKRLEGVALLARELGADADPLVRQELARLGIEVDLMRLLTERALEAVARGEDPGVALPLGKLQWSYLMQSLAELAVRLGGARSLIARGGKYELPGDWPYHCVYSRMTTIGAGTTEVQKNILAYRALGLPREADVAPGPAEPRDPKLDETRAALRDTVRRFLAEVCPTSWVRGLLDDARGTTDEVWARCADLGLLGVLVPEAQGGLGLGYADLGVVLEELGRAVHPGPYASCALGGVATLSAVAAPDDAQAQALLSSIASGRAIAVLADQEVAGAARATAVSSNGTWRVSGTWLVPDGAAADALLVAARAGDELGVFAAQANEARVTPLPTVDGTRKLAEVVLQNASTRRLGGGDASAALGDVRARIAAGLVADAVGAADRVLDIATEYAKVRRQFDRPIGAFQAVQHKLADMLRSVELARAGAAEALRLADGPDAPAFQRAAAAAKAFASDALVRVGADAIQVLGGIGFTWEHDAHLYYKRLLSMSLVGGGAAEHRRAYADLWLADR